MKKYFLIIWLFCIQCGFFCIGQTGTIYTFAGNGSAGFSGDGGLATAAQLNRPTDVFKDTHGNVYIADRGNNRVRKVNTAGIISTIAGNGIAAYAGDGGPATAASFDGPKQVTVDRAGKIYIADQHNNVIRMIDSSGIISTIAGTGVAGFAGDGGPATNALLDTPTGVAVDLSGNIYIADSGFSRIRKINTSGMISTYAGGGPVGFTTDGVPATSVSLCTMRYVSVDNKGVVYFSNQNCWHFLKITTDGRLYNVAGNHLPSYSGDGGAADSANIEGPFGIWSDNGGNVFLCANGNNRVRMVNKYNIIFTEAGTGVHGYSGDGGPAILAEFNSIYGIYADSADNVYFADMGSSVIRSFTALSYADTLCAGAAITLPKSTDTGSWASSNSLVATVGSQSGTTTGVAAGTAIITYNATIPEAYLIIVSGMVVTANISPILCYGMHSGSISTHVYGGADTYRYTWSTGDTLSAVYDLGEGAYTLSVKDVSTQCVATDTFVLTQPDSLRATADALNDACRTGIGSIKIAVDGGSPPYQYLWSNNATGAGISGLLPGVYTVYITDANACVETDAIALSEDSCISIVVHDVFTPDGDGINDVWVIEGLQNYPENTVQVFDKWGARIYEKSNYRNDWDGAGKTALPDGTYYYLVKLNAANGAGGASIFTGSLLIKR